MSSQVLNLTAIQCGTINRKLSRHISENSSAEQQLWMAVIFKAITDIKTRRSKPLNARSRLAVRKSGGAREKAIHWLFTDNRDFLTVCELADIDPEYVRRIIKAINNDISH